MKLHLFTISLREDSSHGRVRCIHFHYKRQFRMGCTPRTGSGLVQTNISPVWCKADSALIFQRQCKHAVLFQVTGKDKDIIQINNHKLVQQFSKNIVYEVFKGRRGITKTKRHEKGLKKSISGSKGGFPSVSWTNVDKVIPPSPRKSSFVNTLAEWSLSNIAEIIGSG